MTLSVIFVVIALLVVVSLWRLAHGQRKVAQNSAELTGRLRAVDLQAFQNLVSLKEDEFLRRNLTPRVFRKVQRLRLRAAIGYVEGVAANAVILLRLGEWAADSADAEVVTAGHELAEAASRLRVYSLLVLSKLYMGVLLPGVSLSPGGIAEQYGDLARLISRLNRLRVPNGASRIPAIL
jgi:hypothetical protein